jgi:glutaredoxin 3
MPEAIIYTTPICPYCVRAKALLDQLGVPYQEIDVSADPILRQKIVERAGGRMTVPQIFINGISIGGCDDLYALHKTGELEKLLTVP